MKPTIVAPNNGARELIYVLAVAAIVIIFSGTAILFRLRNDNITVLHSYQISVFKDLKSEEQGIFNELYTAATEIIDQHKDNEPKWISTKQLEEDYIAPFVKDIAWRNRGKSDWKLKILNTNRKHIAMFLGKPLETGKTGSFLLVLLHDHPQIPLTAEKTPPAFEEETALSFETSHNKDVTNTDTSVLTPSFDDQEQSEHEYSETSPVIKKPSHAPFEIWYNKKINVNFPPSFSDQQLISRGWKEVIAYKGEEELIRVKGKEYLDD